MARSDRRIMYHVSEIDVKAWTCRLAAIARHWCVKRLEDMQGRARCHEYKVWHGTKLSLSSQRQVDNKKWHPCHPFAVINDTPSKCRKFQAFTYITWHHCGWVFRPTPSLYSTRFTNHYNSGILPEIWNGAKCRWCRCVARAPEPHGCDCCCHSVMVSSSFNLVVPAPISRPPHRPKIRLAVKR